MGHKSRVCAVLFDVDSSSYEKEENFWAGALGREIQFNPSEKYTSLSGELDYLVQSAETGREGVHMFDLMEVNFNSLDIETIQRNNIDRQAHCEELEIEILTVAGQMNAVQYRFIKLLAEFDDNGTAAPGGDVTFNIAANAGLLVTAQDLENDNAALGLVSALEMVQVSSACRLPLRWISRYKACSIPQPDS